MGDDFVNDVENELASINGADNTPTDSTPAEPATPSQTPATDTDKATMTTTPVDANAGGEGDKGATDEANTTTPNVADNQEPVQSDQPTLTMDDVMSLQNQRDDITKELVQQQIDENKGKLYEMLFNPQTKEEWSVEALTGDDGKGGFINPATKEVFTQLEAAQYLSGLHRDYNQSLQNFNESAQEASRNTINAVVDAKYIINKYKDILDSHPGLEQELSDGYKKIATMTKDGKYIISAPMSLRQYFEQTLSRMVAQPKQENAPTTTPATQTPSSPANTTTNGRATMDARTDDVIKHTTGSSQVNGGVVQPKPQTFYDDVEAEMQKFLKKKA